MDGLRGTNAAPLGRGVCMNSCVCGGESECMMRGGICSCMVNR